MNWQTDPDDAAMARGLGRLLELILATGISAAAWPAGEALLWTIAVLLVAGQIATRTGVRWLRERREDRVDSSIAARARCLTTHARTAGADVDASATSASPRATRSAAGRMGGKS